MSGRDIILVVEATKKESTQKARAFQASDATPRKQQIN
jgi:hypothetical protein